MSGVRVVEFMSLDGVIRGTGPDGRCPRTPPTPTGRGRSSPATHGRCRDVFRRAGGFLFGRRTYEIFALWLHPLVLGNGERLFGPRTDPAQLRLTGSRVTEDGLVLLDHASVRAPAAMASG